MQKYTRHLAARARQLRVSMTEGERRLWRYLRGKRIECVRFYRQRPIGEYIVDFYAPAPKLVIEVDGGQHYEPKGLVRDRSRDAFLEARGLKVLRFSNLEVLQQTEGVVEAIRLEVESRLGA